MMQALVLDYGLSYCADFPLPCLAADDALIRLKLAGICATDLELVKGYAGFTGVVGHEFVGIVDAVGGEQHRHWLGRRVVGDINIGCNHCDDCRNDGSRHCLNRTVLGIRGKHGAFADYFTLPLANLFAVPEQVPDEAAVFAEPLAAALRVVEQLRALPITQVAVLGSGRLGLLIAKVLALAGYGVTVAGRSAASLRLPEAWRLATASIHEVADNTYDCVVDATGQPAGLAEALRIIKPCGHLVLKSTFSASEAVDLSKIVVGEINLIGSRCGSMADALAVLRQNAVPVETMIDGRYALRNGLMAFEHAARSSVRKILLEP